MTIQCIDDFLPKEVFSYLSDLIPDEVLWHYDDSSVTDGDGFPQFVHEFYVNHKPDSEYYDDILNVVKLIPDLHAINRIKVNATPRSSSVKMKPYHNDVWVDNVPAPLKICIIMINSNDGFTSIKDKNGKIHQFQSKANRALLFPNEYEHSGTTCTDKDLRLILNVVYA